MLYVDYKEHANPINLPWVVMRDFSDKSEPIWYFPTKEFADSFIAAVNGGMNYKQTSESL